MERRESHKGIVLRIQVIENHRIFRNKCFFSPKTVFCTELLLSLSMETILK